MHETLPTIYLFPSAPPHKIERPRWDSESRGANNKLRRQSQYDVLLVKHHTEIADLMGYALLNCTKMAKWRVLSLKVFFNNVYFYFSLCLLSITEGEGG